VQIERARGRGDARAKELLFLWDRFAYTAKQKGEMLHGCLGALVVETLSTKGVYTYM
jgi:hypothetical protein